MYFFFFNTMKIGNVSNIHDVKSPPVAPQVELAHWGITESWQSLGSLGKISEKSEDFGYSMSRENPTKTQRHVFSNFFVGDMFGLKLKFCGDNETTNSTLSSMVSFIFSAFNKPKPCFSKAPGTFSGRRSVRRERRDWGPLSNAMADPMLCLCTWT